MGEVFGEECQAEAPVLCSRPLATFPGEMLPLSGAFVDSLEIHELMTSPLRNPDGNSIC